MHELPPGRVGSLLLTPAEKAKLRLAWSVYPCHSGRGSGLYHLSSSFLPTVASVHGVPKRNWGSGNILVSLLSQGFQEKVFHCGEIYSVPTFQKVLVKEMNGDRGWACWSAGELLVFQDPRSEEPCKNIQINDNKENWVPPDWVSQDSISF